jgi:hypothetical protein
MESPMRSRLLALALFAALGCGNKSQEMPPFPAVDGAAAQDGSAGSPDAGVEGDAQPAGDAPGPDLDGGLDGPMDGGMDAGLDGPPPDVLAADAP